MFIIELKHAWCSATSGKVRKVTQEAWVEAIGQLNSIQSAEELGISTSTLVKIAMAVVPFYTASVYKDSLNPFNKEEVEVTY